MNRPGRTCVSAPGVAASTQTVRSSEKSAGTCNGSFWLVATPVWWVCSGGFVAQPVTITSPTSSVLFAFARIIMEEASVGNTTAAATTVTALSQ